SQSASPSPAPIGQWRCPCRDDTPVSSLRDIVSLLSVTITRYMSTHRFRGEADGTRSGLRAFRPCLQDHVPQLLLVQETVQLVHEQPLGARPEGGGRSARVRADEHAGCPPQGVVGGQRFGVGDVEGGGDPAGLRLREQDRKSTRLNSSHVKTPYAV